MRYHLAPMRMAAVENTGSKGWGACGGTGTLTHCRGDAKRRHRYENSAERLPPN